MKIYWKVEVEDHFGIRAVHVVHCVTQWQARESEERRGYTVISVREWGSVKSQ